MQITTLGIDLAKVRLKPVEEKLSNDCAGDYELMARQ
jgi:hypothetical protein